MAAHAGADPGWVPAGSRGETSTVIPTEAGKSTASAPAEPKIETAFRGGSLTAISVVLGFSLSFLNRWAALSGPWTHVDLLAVAAISVGIIFQIVALTLMLPVGSLVLRRYNRTIRVFLIGLVLVSLGVVFAITGDILGFEQTVMR